jgi:hypothetical protein
MKPTTRKVELGLWLKKQREEDRYNTVGNSGIMGEKKGREEKLVKMTRKEDS